MDGSRMSSARLNDPDSPPSKAQKWFRNHASMLMTSYRSSGLIEHKVTKGESREYQILDTLNLLLPARISVERNIVIVDSQDTESPKFDGALIDRSFWPLLFQEEGGTKVVMLESVLAAIEVKSSLNKPDLQDIFEKTKKLRSMKCAGNGAFLCPPLVTAFAYECPNTRLTFFDFAVHSGKFPDLTPTLICILNQALFGLARQDGATFLPVDQPGTGHIPVIFETQDDTLLIYLYFLSRWATMGSKTADTFRKYSKVVFSNLTVFHFDADFLGYLASDPSAQEKARSCFEGNKNKSIEEAYLEARNQVGLT